jgi:hypothetical protein
MQQAIMNADPRKFLDELNAVLLDGWEIVPGSWGASALQQVQPADNMRSKYTLPDGTTYVKFFFCVVHDGNINNTSISKRGSQHVASQPTGNGNNH